MSIVVDAGDGRIIEFPDEATANAFFASNAPAPQEQVSLLEDAGKSLGSGIVRGAIGTAELPEMLTRAGIRGYQEVKQLLGGEVENEMPILDTKFGKFLRDATTLDDYEAQTGVGKFAGTIGEFTGGAGALGTAGKVAKAGSKVLGSAKGQKIGEAVARTGLTREAQATAAVAGAGSEAFGQLTEGSELEPYARIVGALATPTVANATFASLARRADKMPTINALEAKKNQAYKLAFAQGNNFTPNEVAGMAAQARLATIVKDVDDVLDQSTMEALTLVDDIAARGTPVTMRNIDKLRRELFRKYNAANDEVVILDIIQSLDNMVEAKGATNALINNARVANKQYSKAKLIEKVFKKTDDQVAGSGSGGNTVNKYKQSLTRILNDDRKLKYFTADERDAMQAIVDGSLGQNTLRLLGKASPSGNGLMMYLNVGAIAYNPAMLGATVMGFLSKGQADKAIIAAADRLQDLIAAGGVRPTRKEAMAAASEIISKELARRGTGLAAMEQ